MSCHDIVSQASSTEYQSTYIQAYRERHATGSRCVDPILGVLVDAGTPLPLLCCRHSKTTPACSVLTIADHAPPPTLDTSCSQPTSDAMQPPPSPSGGMPDGTWTITKCPDGRPCVSTGAQDRSCRPLLTHKFAHQSCQDQAMRSTFRVHTKQNRRHGHSACSRVLSHSAGRHSSHEARFPRPHTYYYYLDHGPGIITLL